MPIEIPAKDVLNLLSYIRDNVGAAADPIDGATKLMLADLTGLSIDHLERHFADRYKSFGNFAIVNSSQYDAFGEIDAGQLTNANKKIRIAVPAASLTDFDNDVTSGMLVELYEDSSNYLLGRITSRTNDSLRSSINGRYVNLSTLETVGSVGSGDTVEFRLYVQGDGLVPIAESADTGKVLKATGINTYDWRDEDDTNYNFFADDAAVSGTANAITITATPVPDAYAEGMAVIFEAAHSNTASATINLNSLGAKTIVREDGTTLQAGDLHAGTFHHLVYDGVFFVLLNRFRHTGYWDTINTFTTGVTDEGSSSTWTVAVSSFTSGDRVRLRGHTKVANQDRRGFTLTLDYVDFPSGNAGGASGDKLWSYATPANGARFQFRRNSTNLHVSTAATLESYRLVVERWVSPS